MCTIFTIALANKVLFGNNEDNERLPDETFVAFIPKQEVPLSWSTPGAEGNSMINGIMLVGVREGDQLLPQGGVNDQGLCFDINGLPAVSFNGQGGTPWRLWFNSFDILWYCQTAREVEDWFRAHQLSFPMWEGGQFHFADSKGEAVVLSVGATGSYVFTWKGNEPFLVSTNFNLANSENRYGHFPCPRFEKTTEMLGEIDEEAKLTVDACADILDAVHVKYKEGTGTVYSNIFDLVNKRAYIYHLHDFDKVKEFDLEEELSKIESNDTAIRFQMKGGELFSRLEGVRVYLIEDLFF